MFTIQSFFGKVKIVLLFILIGLSVGLFVPTAQAAGASSPPVQEINPIWQLLQPIAVKAGWLLLVILLDLILGVVTALKQKRFEWQKLADFLGDYGPKIVGWLALEAMGFLPAEYQALGGIGGALAVGAYGLIFLAAVASVLGHAQAIGILPNMTKAGVPPTHNWEQMLASVEKTDDYKE